MLSEKIKNVAVALGELNGKTGALTDDDFALIRTARQVLTDLADAVEEIETTITVVENGGA